MTTETNPAAGTLRTPRLLLRPWLSSDLGPFAALNADPQVMEHFPAVLGREESDAFATASNEAISRQGWGRWALEVIATGEFIGFTGLHRPTFEAPFMPATEIAWRLSRRSWGQGYATEAARAALGFAFGRLGLDEVVSFTATVNLRSSAVMRRLGMIHDPAGDFDHPVLPAGHRLRRHVLYRLSATGWRERYGTPTAVRPGEGTGE
ncbi:GNAT family N-acetyltransferase [Planobispora takensis]|uniref:N-acetyltransferase n=1 Tax=Planobispora takensis TaxID=1367882 RepID=A0A8J3SRB7_9ACTN|nr:GNAT family N-acetyltransferase [Planobispora takensis]GIH99131.1 N-acetyltransferase [Planobispora takensis]